MENCGAVRFSCPDDEVRRYLVCLKYWTLNLNPLLVYPKVLSPPNFIILVLVVGKSCSCGYAAKEAKRFKKGSGGGAEAQTELDSQLAGLQAAAFKVIAGLALHRPVSPDDGVRRYLVYLEHWTLNLNPLMVYPKVLFPPNLSVNPCKQNSLSSVHRHP